MIDRVLPYVIAFVLPLLVTLVLTPVVREMNRKLGMVDKPDPRRINKTPIPRGGGLALFVGVCVTYAVMMKLPEFAIMGGVGAVRAWKLFAMTGVIVMLGYADDKFSLRPVVKLAGQIAVAVLTWWWVDLGFCDLWPELPVWLDCALTVLWIVGAVNAFNLIDGLDGLASGLALIATLGMGGTLFFLGKTSGTYFYLAFAGGLLGFLRYNFNPASVFLGDSGSMMIGFLISVLPLCSHTPNSFLVSIGVPMLAMGVPIFDTSLAILRRTIRRFLNTDAKVMGADADHLHHRILRASGMNQRKAAFVLYAIAAGLVLTGFIGLSLETRAGGLYLAAFAVFAVIFFRDMARVELFDAGSLLNRMARTNDVVHRRRWAKLAIPFYLVFDIVLLSAAFFAVCWALKIPVTVRTLKSTLPIRVVATFGCLVFFRTYVTIWARAVLSNYIRLLLACLLGAAIGAVAVYYIPSVPASKMKAFSLAYSALTFILLASLRVMRPAIRDFFYLLDCKRLVARKDISRILVYGTGLRYKAFRRELVRTTSANERIIVGLLDDDIVLRNHYIGGMKIYGTMLEAPEIINRLNVDAVVIACDISDDWLKVVKKTLAPCGVKITQFGFNEREIQQWLNTTEKK